MTNKIPILGPDKSTYLVRPCPAGCAGRRQWDLNIIEFDQPPDGTIIPVPPLVRIGKIACGAKYRGLAVQCARCGTRGPIKPTLDAAADAWNRLIK